MRTKNENGVSPPPPDATRVKYQNRSAEPEIDGAGATAAALVNQHVGHRGEPVHAVHLLHANTSGFSAQSLADFLFDHLRFFCSKLFFDEQSNLCVFYTKCLFL